MLINGSENEIFLFQMDGVAALASTPSAELLDRLSTVEKMNAVLQSSVTNLEKVVQDLQQKLSALTLGGSTANNSVPTPPQKSDPAPKPAAKPADDDDDDGVDLFASDSEVKFNKFSVNLIKHNLYFLGRR